MIWSGADPAGRCRIRPNPCRRAAGSRRAARSAIARHLPRSAEPPLLPLKAPGPARRLHTPMTRFPAPVAVESATGAAATGGDPILRAPFHRHGAARPRCARSMVSASDIARRRPRSRLVGESPVAANPPPGACMHPPAGEPSVGAGRVRGASTSPMAGAAEAPCARLRRRTCRSCFRIPIASLNPRLTMLPDRSADSLAIHGIGEGAPRAGRRRWRKLLAAVGLDARPHADRFTARLLGRPAAADRASRAPWCSHPKPSSCATSRSPPSTCRSRRR